LLVVARDVGDTGGVADCVLREKGEGREKSAAGQCFRPQTEQEKRGRGYLQREEKRRKKKSGLSNIARGRDPREKGKEGEEKLPCAFTKQTPCHQGRKKKGKKKERGGKSIFIHNLSQFHCKKRRECSVEEGRGEKGEEDGSILLILTPSFS